LNNEDKSHSPSSIITDSIASKVGVGSGAILMANAGQEEAKAAMQKLNRKSASTH